MTQTIDHIVRDAMNRFIVEPDNRLAFRFLLDRLIQLTGSEYGFIGEIHRQGTGEPYLQIHAYTDIAWDEPTRALLARSRESGLRFDNMDTLFGQVIKTDEVVITNSPSQDPRAGGLPDGHPALKAFLGCPLRFGGETTGMVGLANRTGGYDQELVNSLEPALNCCGMMIYSRVAELQRDAMRQQAEEAKRLESLIHLAGNVAHDLNNWLTVIMSSTESLQRGCDDREEVIGVVQEAAKRATRLAHRMLEFSGATASRRTEVDLGELAVRAVTAMKSIAPSMRFDTDGCQQGLFASVDDAALDQAIGNVLKNAIEASDGLDDAVIKVGVSRDSTDTICLRVADQGSGIPTADRDRVLEPYYSTKGVGRGFGLATVDGIIRAHHGALTIVSSVESGTEVSLRLPEVKQPDDVASLQPTTVAGELGSWLLLVDDDPTVRMALRRLLTAVGFHVMTAASGAEALELVQQRDFDFAMFDVSMPAMNGVELLGRLRVDHPDLPVLLMSGYTATTVSQDMLSDGVTGFIRKPFAVQEVLQALRGLASKVG